MTMDIGAALNPRHSVVVEACAGSGKTWLLVSRIVRLLLDGVKPGEILAITFTRKAAQEMQARLHEWLQLLATDSDEKAKEFLRERALVDVDDALLAKARGLYRDVLLAQPAVTISTFHGWFMRVVQRAPLNAGAPVGMQLAERTAALREEAWQAFAGSLRVTPESETAEMMQWLLEQYGLANTRALLENFTAKRAEWWAYTQGLENAVEWATAQLQNELGIDDPEFDPVADWGVCGNSEETLFAFIAQLASNGTEPQKAKASELEQAWSDTQPEARFDKVWPLMFTQKNEPRTGSPLKPTAKQDAEAFLYTRYTLQAGLQAARDALTEIEALRMNRAVLHCGAVLLAHYQELKQRQQQMDFTDLEWQVCRLLNQGECAEYLQYKMDSRYRHVLLDEFQDTNPLQWQILKAWFDAAAAADSRPTVFLVGDPKQSIYRFRRADARLFGVARNFLVQEFAAQCLEQNETRRNAPTVLQAVNAVFASSPEGFSDFAEHSAHHKSLPGHVEALPLANVEKQQQAEEAGTVLRLRNPLTTPRTEEAGSARDEEAKQFAGSIADIVANWSVQGEGGKLRRAEYRDIMVLVRKRTHLRVYEQALRARHIPFLTSRRGGLLDTLEAEDIQALLTFLITPFADLALAQALRSPLFSCSDEDLMRLAEIPPGPPFIKGGESSDGSDFSVPPFAKGGRGSWWQRLLQLDGPSPALQRARNLLGNWLTLAGKLPVHDLLDRIYFEGDLIRRYTAALPAELQETAQANLQAFMEIALNVDAGRYPSLPRFLAELRELRRSEDDAPDEGRVGESGHALRIYTVHEAKGLEAPIVWLLDANDSYTKTESYNVLLDWPPATPHPAHFSLYTDMHGRGARRTHYFEAEGEYARREQMNLLYVAMTRAKQALLVSGNGELAEGSWYGRIAAATVQGNNPLRVVAGSAAVAPQEPPVEADAALLRPISIGKRVARSTSEQQRGIWLHALLQHLTPPFASSTVVRDEQELMQQCGIPSNEMETLWQQAQRLLVLPELQRFFDPQYYRRACNEMPYVSANGDLKRIDRLVEFDHEVWVLDYKLGESGNAACYRAQMREYRDAMQAVYAGKAVRCALLFAGGTLSEVE